MLYVFFCQDSEGRTPIHAAISNQHNVIIQLLISHPDIRLNIRDRQGMTPFACAMTHKNNKAAEAILKREPGAAEQVSASCCCSVNECCRNDLKRVLVSRWTTKGATFSTWLCRIQTLKVSCS